MLGLFQAKKYRKPFVPSKLSCLMKYCQDLREFFDCVLKSPCVLTKLFFSSDLYAQSSLTVSWYIKTFAHNFYTRNSAYIFASYVYTVVILFDFGFKKKGTSERIYVQLYFRSLI